MDRTGGRNARERHLTRSSSQQPVAVKRLDQGSSKRTVLNVVIRCNVGRVFGQLRDTNA